MLGAALVGALSELARLEEVPLLEGATPVLCATQAYARGHATTAAAAAAAEEFAFTALTSAPAPALLAPRELVDFVARQRQQFVEAMALATGSSAAVLSDLIFDAYDDQCRKMEAAAAAAKSRTVREMALEATRRRRKAKLRRQQGSAASASPRAPFPAPSYS